jgi:hypothetical protein
MVRQGAPGLGDGSQKLALVWRCYGAETGFRRLARWRQATQRLITSRTAPAMGQPVDPPSR